MHKFHEFPEAREWKFPKSSEGQREREKERERVRERERERKGPDHVKNWPIAGD